jgi:hypothetical protein
MRRRNPSDWNNLAELHDELAPDGLDIGHLVNGDWTEQFRREMQALHRSFNKIGRHHCPRRQSL